MDTYQDWSGYEYVPASHEELRKFCDVVGYDWWDGVDAGCLQLNGDSYVVAVDGYVWEITEKEFTNILEKLGEGK